MDLFYPIPLHPLLGQKVFCLQSTHTFWISLFESPQRHLISTTHGLLFEDIPSNQSACAVWERDLSIHLSPEDWEQIHPNTHKGSVNVSTKENGYKVQTRWYKNPTLLQKFYADLPDTCWRCQSERGSLLHLWWACPLIQNFWSAVHCNFTQVTTYTLDHFPAQFLLHHSTLPHGAYFKSLAMHMVNAAKQCIPLHWGSTQPPSIKEWLTKINKILEMERLISIARDTPIKFSTKWACWTHFQTTAEFSKHSNPPSPSLNGTSQWSDINKYLLSLQSYITFISRKHLKLLISLLKSKPINPLPYAIRWREWEMVPLPIPPLPPFPLHPSSHIDILPLYLFLFGAPSDIWWTYSHHWPHYLTWRHISPS